MDPKSDPPRRRDAPRADPPAEENAGVGALVRRWGAMLAAAALAGAAVGVLVAAPGELRSWQVALVCALIGVVGALGLAAMFERAGAVLRGRHDADALTGARCLGVLGREAWRASPSPALVTIARTSAAADDYRLLAGKLQATGARSVALLRVDAGAPGVGSQLAAAMADRGARVALIDPAHATTTLLLPGTRPQLMSTTAPGDVVDAAGAAGLVAEVLSLADVVLVDLPSVERAVTSVVWAAAVDGTLLAAQVGRTPRSSLAAVTESLQLARARLLGTVLGAPPRLLRLHT
jgi:hypothetical protein